MIIAVPSHLCHLFSKYVKTAKQYNPEKRGHAHHAYLLADFPGLTFINPLRFGIGIKNIILVIQMGLPGALCRLFYTWILNHFMEAGPVLPDQVHGGGIDLYHWLQSFLFS